MIVKPDPVVVLDTNVIISALLFRNSTPRRAVMTAFEKGKVLSSSRIRNELREVFCKPKFDRYIERESRLRNLEEMIEDMESVLVTERVRLCRDLKDDKFIELAFAGQANFLITGDSDLLALHPFRGVAILTPAAYLALYP